MGNIKNRPVRGKSLNHMRSAYRWDYIFILPGAVLLFLFSYVPMFGILIAFKDYKIVHGIFDSPFNQFNNFKFLQDPFFWFTVKNTLLLTFYRLLVTFPAPIILSLMINEVRLQRTKSIIQSSVYLPYFVSWIVVAYLFNSLFAMDTGIVNNIRQALGMSQIHFMGKPEYFRSLIVFVNLWKSTGWGTIIYLAALANINPELHEAACIDGAGRFARIWHINVKGILPTISILLILSMPSLLSAGYESILPFINPANMEVANVLDVYVIRLGLSQAQFGVATAIGLSVSMISLLIILGSNYVAKKLDQTTLL